MIRRTAISLPGCRQAESGLTSVRGGLYPVPCTWCSEPCMHTAVCNTIPTWLNRRHLYVAMTDSCYNRPSSMTGDSLFTLYLLGALWWVGLLMCLIWDFDVVLHIARLVPYLLVPWGIAGPASMYLYLIPGIQLPVGWMCHGKRHSYDKL